MTLLGDEGDGQQREGSREPGDEAERLTRRFHFDLRNESLDAWFERFIDALSRDRGLRHR